MISLRQLALLSAAVTDAEMWRGNLLGAAPLPAIEEFDERIREMREAVKSARKDRAKLAKLLKGDV